MCTDSLILLYQINSVIFGKERKFPSPSVRVTPCIHICPTIMVQYFSQQLVLKHKQAAIYLRIISVSL